MEMDSLTHEISTPHTRALEEVSGNLAKVCKQGQGTALLQVGCPRRYKKGVAWMSAKVPAECDGI